MCVSIPSKPNTAMRPSFCREHRYSRMACCLISACLAPAACARTFSCHEIIQS
ncbi:hypothetical protein C8Q79DRAFT_949858 [Trametes meyenii]|nr:hypothetical protein C8Q79DRAFT_949858 [Trametes meyenii]